MFDICLGLKQNEFVRRNNSGFTLIELILVMAIIGILAVVGIGAFTQATVKSRDTQRKSDLNQIVKGLESFNIEVGKYPESDGNGKILCPTYNEVSLELLDSNCFGALTASIGDSNLVKSDKLYTTSIYLSKLPTDSDSRRIYFYEKTATGFALYAALENLEDRDIVVDESGTPTVWDTNCSSSTTTISCNYKLSDSGLVRVKL